MPHWSCKLSSRYVGHALACLPRGTQKSQQPPKRRQSPMNVMKWLLDSDPAIRWQVMRDLTGEDERVVEAERSRVAAEGWGARLLDTQSARGHWGAGGDRGWLST